MGGWGTPRGPPYPLNVKIRQVFFDGFPNSLLGFLFPGKKIKVKRKVSQWKQVLKISDVEGCDMGWGICIVINHQVVAGLSHQARLHNEVCQT